MRFSATIRFLSPRIFSPLPIILLSVLLVSGCTVPVRISDIDGKKPSSYNHSVSLSGLSLAADPFSEEDRLKRYFGEDLLERGILPILVVMQNVSAADAYIPLPDQSGLVLRTSNAQEGTGNVVAEGAQRGYQGVPLDMEVLLLLFFPVSLGSMVALETHSANETAIINNMRDKRLYEKTVYPGSVHSGFLYFRLTGRDKVKDIMRLSLSLKNLKTGEIMTATIEFP